ncbi:MAG: EMC3/TMCO1 family protein [Candidatus Micrarchaeaceae archaeon]
MGLIPVLPPNVEIIIIVMAVAYTAISIAAQRLLTNPKRMREIQAKVQSVQKEMNELLKNKAPQEHLSAKQKEIMPLLGEQMKSSIKPMLVIFPLLLLTYYVIIPNIPIIKSNDISGSKGLFFIVVFALGIVSAIVILVYDRKKSKEEAKTMVPAQKELDAEAKENYK